MLYIKGSELTYLFFNIYFYLFWLHPVLVTACELVSCNVWDSSSPTSDGTQVPYIGRAES